METGECEHVLEGHTKTVRAIAVHDNIIYAGSYDSTASIWDLRTEQRLQVLSGHEGQIYDIVSNGKVIVTGALDATARVWDQENG